MDELRASLHDRRGLDAGFSGFLNWVSEEAFGARPADRPGGSSSAAVGAAAPLPGLYRWVMDSPWARALDSGMQGRPGYVPTPEERRRHRQQQRRERETLSDLKLSSEQRGTLQRLQTLLVCSEASVVRVARRFPGVLDMDPKDVLRRLLSLKSALPGCDVLLMVETVPHLLLGGKENDTAQQVESAAAVLRDGLAGADIERMLEHDPWILFEETDSLATGVAHLRDLWDVDEAALQNSEPFMLALAVKALSTSGPPASF